MKIGDYEFRVPDLPKDEYYVYFDINTGEIYKVTNEFDDSPEYNDVSYIKEDFLNVEPLINGTKQLQSKMVTFDTTEYKYVLDNKFTEDEMIINQAMMHEIDYQPGAQVVIQKDLSLESWKFFINSDFKEMLNEKGVALKTVMLFSVTEKHNPNVLYKTMYVYFQNLIDYEYYMIPFESQFEFDNKDASLYTIKKFDSYSFEVINE